VFDANAELVDSQKVFVVARHVLHDEIVVGKVFRQHCVDPLLFVFHINVSVGAILRRRRSSQPLLAKSPENCSVNHSDVVVENLKDSELDQEEDNESCDADPQEVDNVAENSRLFPLEESNIWRKEGRKILSKLFTLQE
jgi:hypothetical protein